MSRKPAVSGRSARQADCMNPNCSDGHIHPADLTPEWWSRPDLSNGNFREQKKLDQTKRFTRIPVKEAEIPDPTKPARQYMLKQQPEKIRPRKGAVFPNARFAFAIPEGDLSITVADDLLFRNDSAIQIPGKVFQRRFAGAGILAAHDPALSPDPVRELPAVFLHPEKDLFPKDFSQCIFRKQETPVLALPETVFLVNGPCRNQKMDVWMKLQPSAVGVEDARHSDVTAQETLIGTESSKSRGPRREQEGVELPLVSPCDGPQKRGNSKGDEKIRHRQKLFTLPVEPGAGLVILASRAAPVAAGMADMDQPATIGAFDDHLPRGWSPASQDISHCPLLRWKKPVAISGFQPGSIFSDQVGELHTSSPRLFEAIHERVDRFRPVLERRLGQSCVNGGRLWAGVSEKILNEAQMNPSFDEVRRETVAKGMDADPLGNPDVAESRFECLLDAATIHGSCRVLDGFRRSILAGKKQTGVPMGFPKPPKDFVSEGWQGHEPVFVPFRIADVDLHFCAIDVGNPEVETFTQTEPHAVDGEKKDAIPGPHNSLEETVGLFDSENVGQGFESWRLHDVHGFPGLPEDVLPEEFQAESIDLDGAPGVGFHQLGKVPFEIFPGQIVRTSTEMLGQPTDGLAIQLNGGRPLALELESLQVVNIQGFESSFFIGVHGIPPRWNFPRAGLKTRGTKRYPISGSEDRSRDQQRKR